MKLFTIDWQLFFKNLPVWDKLSLDTRGALVQMEAGHPFPITAVSNDLSLLTQSNLLERLNDARRVKLHPDAQPFFRVMRAMYRHNILASADRRILTTYLHDHFNVEEKRGLLQGHVSHYYDSYYYDFDQQLARRSTSVGWLNDFLALKDLRQCRKWEKVRQPGFMRWSRDEKPGLLLSTSGIFQAVQTLIRQFMKWPDPVPFSELPARFEKIKRPRLAKAVFASIRYLFLFPTVSRPDMTPVLALWPSISQRLHRPRPQPPGPVTADQTFCLGYLMEDMTNVLVVTVGEPLRIRGSDHALFIKAQRQIESGMVPIPDWVAGPTNCTLPKRIKDALLWLGRMELTRCRGVAGKNLRLEATKRAEDWLGLSAGDRLKKILDWMKLNKSSRKTQGSRDQSNLDYLAIRSPLDRQRHEYDDVDEGEDDFLTESDPDDSYRSSYGPDDGWMPDGYEWNQITREIGDLSKAMARAFISLGSSQFVSMNDFVQYQMVAKNPLLKAKESSEDKNTRSKSKTRSGSFPLVEEEMEDIWRKSLESYLVDRLLPLGCIQTGMRKKEEGLCIALTDVGRYFLGLVDHFDYGIADDASEKVVIQPNFDVVFLGRSPLAEARLSRFSERQGKGLGNLFKITRKSIFCAAGGGMTVTQVLDTLRRICSKSIPSNVEHEIKNWFSKCRHIDIKNTILIRCPDAQTASRVIAAGGRKIQMITPTVVELTDGAIKTTILRKLREGGVFLNTSRGCKKTSAQQEQYAQTL